MVGVTNVKNVAFNIVERFIGESGKRKVITNHHLNKLLWFTWIDFYNAHQKYLFDDKPFVAWLLGPVVIEVYDEYSCYGADPILLTSWSKEIDSNVPEEASMVIAKTINRCEKKSPYDMIRESQRSGGAWDLVYNDIAPGLGEGLRISFPLIVELECGA